MIKQVLVLAIFLALILPAHADQQFDLVTPDWVTSHANDPSVLILDVRIDPHQYFIGHAPNAVNLADNIVRGPKEGLPVQYLPVAMQANLLSRAGVKDNQTVAIYSDSENTPGTTMIAYTLEKMGHPNVKFVDGGWTAYKATQQPTQQYPSYKPGKLSAREVPTYVTLTEVRDSMGKPGVKLIDARPADGYAGRVNTWMRNGHIPGAINIPWQSLMEPDNAHKYKSLDQLQAIYDTKGIKKTDTIIVYCGTGREATVEVMALKHLLGYPNVRLYEGAWAEYSSHPELPMRTGDNP